MKAPLGWLGIVKLGLVQTSLGAIVVLTTSTINRVMVVELALPAILPGILVALHYAVQFLRPCWGHGSDNGGRLTPWIIGGMAVLGLGGFGSALATALMATQFWPGVALAVLSFVMIGVGVGASGTCLLVLLSQRVSDERRPAAATVVWVMMISGFIITTITAGHFLDPFSTTRLVAVTSIVSLLAFAVTVLAVHGVEDSAQAAPRAPRTTEDIRFSVAIAEVWAEPQARLFAIFVFVSMIAYSAQDLILEPFAGTVFGMTPGESTKLSGLQHSGVLAGMIIVALATTFAASKAGSLRIWAVGGCVASAIALAALSVAAFVGPAFPLRGTVFCLGVANGAYAVAAIGSMMRLVNAGRPERRGVRMGLWGAAQGVAFGIGGFLGAGATDVARQFLTKPALGYATVFTVEALLFLVSAGLAIAVARQAAPSENQPAFAEPRLTLHPSKG
jgi:MFS transporter, BCD family, chlorophyll transporter